MRHVRCRQAPKDGRHVGEQTESHRYDHTTRCELLAIGERDQELVGSRLYSDDLAPIELRRGKRLEPVSVVDEILDRDQLVDRAPRLSAPARQRQLSSWVADA